jgi:hypothetical protein
MIVGRWGSSVDPNEIVRFDLNSKKHTNLTTFNVEQARTIDWSPPEHSWFTSKRGRKIHNMIVKPAGFDPSKKYPLFVLSTAARTTCGRTRSLAGISLLAKPGYVMLLTNYGLDGLRRRIRGAFSSISADRGRVDGSGADAAREVSVLDASRQVAGGASYGGHLANALEAWSGTASRRSSATPACQFETQWHSGRLYGRELMGGPVWEQNEAWRTQNFVRAATDPHAPSSGEKDPRPLNNTPGMWAVRQGAGAERLLVWPEENTDLNAENSKETPRWNWLGGG